MFLNIWDDIGEKFVLTKSTPEFQEKVYIQAGYVVLILHVSLGSGLLLALLAKRYCF